ncbi:MAG: PspA/IM30 family protein [Planctomycetes bacterium]|nr:PspA/IM30 family protein [Planctomycetota bacterium]
MSWIERFSLVMRTNITLLREKFEDPERMLHQLLIDMDEELEGVRRSVAEALADEIQLRKQVDAARHDAEQWLARAKSAIERQDDASAEAALDQKLRAAERADELTKEYEKQQQETRKLREGVRDLEGKIRQARQRRTLLLARMTRANSTRRINSALERAQGPSAFAEFDRLETKVDRAEALAEAYDRMDGIDPDARELERKFAEQQRSEQLRQELESLRQRVGE